MGVLIMEFSVICEYSCWGGSCHRTCCSLQGCRISVLNPELSLLWKVGVELLLGPKIFFPY